MNLPQSNINIDRMPTVIIYNDIPKDLLGVRFTLPCEPMFSVVPPYKDNMYLVGITLTLFVYSVIDNKDLFKLQTETKYSFQQW